MSDLPWWGWVVVALLAVLVFLRIALGTFRRQVRRQFLNLLRREHPDFEVVRLTPRSVRFRCRGIQNGEFFFARLYTEIAELGTNNEAVREPVYRAFAAELSEGSVDSLSPKSLE